MPLVCVLDDYSNLGALTLMTAAIRLCTLLCVGLVPAKTTRALQAETAVTAASRQTRRIRFESLRSTRRWMSQR